MILGGAVAAAEAQPATPPANAVITPTSQIRIPPPQVRTREQREAAAALAGAAPAPPAREIPFRPTKDEAAYKAGKAAAARQRALQSPGPGIQSPAPSALAPLTGTINFEGVNSVEAGNYIPAGHPWRRRPQPFCGDH